VDKPVIKKTIVVYSGRFQPFHKGHYAAYKNLVSKFGADNVYIGTSDKTDGGKSPFNFKEKVVIMGTMFGIPPSKIVNVKNPYAPKEILAKYDGKTTAYIAAVGEKDASRLAGKYFKPYKGKTGYGYEEIGYTYIIPPESNPISGTDVRNWLSSDKAEKLFLKAYPKFDKEIYKMITKKLIKEEGFPGGIGTGLNLPGGYINGAPTGSANESNNTQPSSALRPEPHPTRHETEHPTDEPDWHKKNDPYDPIAEQIAKLVFEADSFIDEYFLEEEPNPIMDKEFDYTAADGKKKKITVRGALRLPKEHPAHVQANKMIGPDDAPANQPKNTKGKAATQAAKPAQPGQPVKKDQTAQGKIDKEKGGNDAQPEAPNPQKLSGVELKSSAEDRVSKEKKAEEVKSALDNEIKSLNKDEQDFINKGEHKQGSKFMNSLKDGIKKLANTKVVKAIGHTLQHKAEMVSGAYDGVKALASGQKVGSTKNKETGQWEYSDENRKKQIHHMKHFATDVALLVGSVALGGGLAAGAKAVAAGAHSIGHVAHAVGHGAIGAFTHGAGGFAAHLGKDAIKHVALESMGMGGTQAAIGGAGLAGATMGLLEIRSLIKEEEMNNDKFIQNFLNKISEKMETFEMNDEQLLQSIKSYKQGKNFGDLVKEDVNVDVDNGDTVLMGKFKNKKVQVKDIGKDDHGMPTINGKQATTFRTLSEIQKGFFKGKMKIGGEAVEVEVELVGVDNKNRDFVTKVVGVDKKYQNKLPIGSTLPIPARIFRHGGWVKIKVPSAFNEVGVGDWHFKAIMKMWDKAGAYGRKKIGAAVSANPNANRRQVERDLRDTNYEEITDMSVKLGLLKEEVPATPEKKTKGRIIGEFVKFAMDRLKLDTKTIPFSIKLVKDNEFATTFKSFGGFDPVSNDVYVYVSNRSVPDILRTLAHELVHLKQRQGGYIGGPEDGATGSDVENEANAAAGILLRDFGRRNENIYESKQMISEGGAYGHMNHPFDISMNLTFGDLKKIVNNALDGRLGVVREKTDGQALAISWKNGRLIAARNKGHLSNSGASALDMSALASKFGGRGALSDAYNFAMKDLSAAISSLGEKERQSIFKDGSAFCNLEVIYPQNANVIPYGQNLLVFHNVVEYDEKGNAIGGVKGAESKLASMIKDINKHVQNTYTIQGPPITKLPKDEKLSSQKGKFGGMLSKLQSEFGLSDKDGVADYHYAWWMNFVNKSKKNLAQLEKEGLARRWAFDNKSFSIKSIADEDARKWADGVDKDAKDKIMKGNLRKFEDIFLGVGAEVLSFMSSVLTAQPDSALQSIKSSLESSISDIKSGGSVAQIKRLEKELARLNAIGGFEKLVPNEGLVFFYKGNTYKLTGTFAPLNQILGIFKFGR